MATEEVVAKTKEGAVVTFNYDFGATLDEMVDRFTLEICTAHTKRSLVVAAQGHARNLMRAGKSPQEIKAAMDSWKPGAPRVSKSKVDRLNELIAQMSPTEREEYIRELAGNRPASPKKGAAA
jgi:hypothetical protein